MKKWIIAAMVFAFACSPPSKGSAEMDIVARDYVKFVLEVGLYDSDFIDAYYGPEELKPAADRKEAEFPYERFKNDAEALQQRLRTIDLSAAEPILQMRKTSLDKQLTAAASRIDFLAGHLRPFDEESAAQYDAVAPTYSAGHFDALLAELEKALPGEGTLTDRVAAFRKDFIIPKDKLDAVFTAAIDAARERTRQHIPLPPQESFRVEYVTDKAWSGYNWYKGNAYSLIQVNTDLPSYIDRAIDLACHEGYPGHHVFNALLEKNFVVGRGWVEFSVYPLFSPLSLIAEGSANYGIDVAFPGNERIAFEKQVLFPLAGLDPGRAEAYYRIQELTQKLSFADNEAARGFLDGKISREQAIDWLMKYALMTPDRAAQRLRFIEKYRSYVINYNMGLQLVRNWIEKQGGTADQPQKRWDVFEKLLSAPYTPSSLN